MKKYLFAVVALTALSSCVTKRPSEKVVKLEPKVEETLVHLNIGQTVKIEAETNPSTGYNWHLQVPSDCSVTFLKDDTRPLYDDGRVGAPVIGIYEFSATSVGDCVVEFDYSRGWEGKSNHPKTVKFIVK